MLNIEARPLTIEQIEEVGRSFKEDLQRDANRCVRKGDPAMALAALEAQLEKARAALGYYADSRNWTRDFDDYIVGGPGPSVAKHALALGEWNAPATTAQREFQAACEEMDRDFNMTDIPAKASLGDAPAKGEADGKPVRESR